MFATGTAVTTTCVPIGKSFGHNAIRKDDHDAVSAALLVPCREVAKAVALGSLPEDIGGAGQPAEEELPEHWKMRSASSDESSEESHRESRSSSSDGSPEKSPPRGASTEARELAELLREQMDIWSDAHPHVAEEMSRLLFKEKDQSQWDASRARCL